jgi:hypothetical protein
MALPIVVGDAAPAVREAGAPAATLPVALGVGVNFASILYEGSTSF